MRKKTIRNSRRNFISKSIQLGMGFSLASFISCAQATEVKKKSLKKNPSQPWFQISLAQWSLHRAFKSGRLDNLDFAAYTKKKFDIGAIEYVSTFFSEGSKKEYLHQLNQRANDNGIKQLLIMIDGAGYLGELNKKLRKESVQMHQKWVDAAKQLGCHSIRVNAYGKGTAKEVQAAAIEGLGELSIYAKKADLNIIVENHGSYSSDGKWLSELMQQVDMDNCGTLPDFGNFCIAREGGDLWEGKCINEYDRYLGVKEMMPFAKAVSAKAHNFDLAGMETTTDYKKMLDIVKAAGFNGYIGIEYEGDTLSEDEGILKTKALLEKYNV